MGNMWNSGLGEQLLRAAADGIYQEVREILDINAGLVHYYSGTGVTALHLAANFGHITIMEMLIAEGANVNARDNEGYTCLHWAVSDALPRQVEIVEALLKAGADPNITSKEGKSVLYNAVWEQPESVVRALLAGGADPNGGNESDDTALQAAVVRELPEVAVLLCNAPGIDLARKNNRGHNAVHFATAYNDISVVRLVLSRAPHLVDEERGEGWTALHVATSSGYLETAICLLDEFHADINRQDDKGMTPLAYAVTSSWYGLIEALVDRGANINLQDHLGNTVLHLAFQWRAAMNSCLHPEHAPAIHTIYLNIRHLTQYAQGVAMACYFIQQGINTELINEDNKPAFAYLDDVLVWNVVVNFKPPQILVDAAHIVDVVLPNAQPEYPTETEEEEEEEERSLTNSEEEEIKKKETKMLYECRICSDCVPDLVRLEPCWHYVACELCSSFIVCCLECTEFIERRIAANGRIIPRCRRINESRLRYIESKIRTIERMHLCPLCKRGPRAKIFMCGHGTCSKCVEEIEYCPICKGCIANPITLKYEPIRSY